LQIQINFININLRIIDIGETPLLFFVKIDHNQPKTTAAIVSLPKHLYGYLMHHTQVNSRITLSHLSIHSMHSSRCAHFILKNVILIHFPKQFQMFLMGSSTTNTTLSHINTRSHRNNHIL